MIKATNGKCEECPLQDAVFVPSEINQGAKVLFLVEAPGYKEAQEGRPLVGTSGNILNDVIKELGAKREDGSYINAVTCRPTKVVDGKTYNRTPTAEELRLCNPRLEAEIENLQPLIIVCMGKSPYVALGGDPKNAMRDIVGCTFTWRDRYNVLITYHPAAVAYNGGQGTYKGREIRDEIKRAVGVALLSKHTDKQLRLVNIPITKVASQPILAEMNAMRSKCEAWWKDPKKCKGCKQNFYCYPKE